MAGKWARCNHLEWLLGATKRRLEDDMRFIDSMRSSAYRMLSEFEGTPTGDALQDTLDVFRMIDHRLEFDVYEIDRWVKFDKHPHCSEFVEDAMKGEGNE